MLRCGKCNSGLFSSARAASRRYVCLSGPEHGGCGKLTVVAPPVEELVTEAVLYRLDTAELADALAGRAQHDEERAALLAELAKIEETEHFLMQSLGAGEIDQQNWRSAMQPLKARADAVRRRLARATSATDADRYAGNGKALRARWAGMNLDQQVAVVRALVDHVVIRPGVPGARIVDPERVEPIWSV